MNIRRLLSKKGHKFTSLHRMHSLARQVKKKEKILRVQGKILRLKYSEHRIDVLRLHLLRKDRVSGEQKFRAALEKLAQKFTVDAQNYFQAYQESYELLVEITDMDNRQDFDDLIAIKTLLQQAINSRDLFLFTQRGIKNYKDSFKELLQDLNIDIRYAVKNDRREMHGKDAKVGFWTKRKNDKQLSKDLDKATKKLENNNDDLQELLTFIQGSLAHGVKVDFVDHFSEYIKKFGFIESVIRRVRLDIRELIEHHIYELREITANITMFVQMIRNEKVNAGHVDELFKKLLEDDQKGARLQQWAKREYQEERSVYGITQQDAYLFGQLESRMQHDYNEQIKSVRKIA